MGTIFTENDSRRSVTADLDSLPKEYISKSETKFYQKLFDSNLIYVLLDVVRVQCTINEPPLLM